MTLCSMQACSSFDAQLAQLVGVPFASHGRDRARGLDCWGLVLCASRALFARELPDYSAYSDARQVCDVAPLFDARADWEPIARGDERPGHVIVLRVIGHATHAGIVVKPGHMLHTMLYCNSVVESFDSQKWKARVEGFYSWSPR